MKTRFRVRAIMATVGLGIFGATAAPASGALADLTPILGGLPLVGGLLGGLSDRRIKQDIVPVRWDR